MKQKREEDMADYYTHFSTKLEELTDTERTWLEEELDSPEDRGLKGNKLRMWEKRYGAEEADSWPEFEFVFTGNDLCLYCDDYGNLEHVASIIYEFLRKFRKKDYHIMEWAMTCSKPDPDGFTGGAIVITAKEVEYLSMSDLIVAKTAELEAKKLAG